MSQTLPEAQLCLLCKAPFAGAREASTSKVDSLPAGHCQWVVKQTTHNTTSTNQLCARTHGLAQPGAATLAHMQIHTPASYKTVTKSQNHCGFSARWPCRKHCSGLQCPCWSSNNTFRLFAQESGDLCPAKKHEKQHPHPCSKHMSCRPNRQCVGAYKGTATGPNQRMICQTSATEQAASAPWLHQAPCDLLLCALYVTLAAMLLLPPRLLVLLLPPLRLPLLLPLLSVP